MGEIPPSPGKRWVLVVEDEALFAWSLEQTLLSGGYRVAVADSARSASELLPQRPFFAIVSDLHLPDGSGWQVLKTARRLHPGIFSVVVTGHPEEADPPPLPVADVLSKAEGSVTLMGRLLELLEATGSAI